MKSLENCSDTVFLINIEKALRDYDLENVY